MDRQHKDRQNKFLLIKFICRIFIIQLFSFLLFNVFTSLTASEKHTFEAEFAKRIGGAYIVPDSKASCDFTISLTKSGDGIKFSNLPSTSFEFYNRKSGRWKLLPVNMSYSSETVLMQKI